MKFKDYNFNQALIKNIEDIGFTRPTDIQYKSIGSILKGEDVLAIAQTGTGKTAAFAIPIIQMIHESKKNATSHFVQCIVMVPTRELAMQTANVFNSFEKKTFVKTISLIGGVEQDPQIKKLLEGCDVVVATPGRMFDLNSQGFLNLDKVKILVLDESDHILKLGFLRDVQMLVRKIPAIHQTLFFSATIDKDIKKTAYSLVKNPVRIQISPKNPIAKSIQHKVMFVDINDKRFFLERVINENEGSKILVFVRTKVRAERVKKFLTNVEIDCQTLHSDKEQKDRFEILEKFNTGENKVLIATDITSRGIDFPEIDIVVNYDLPEKAENYVHRIGRTGRAANKGTAYSFCGNEEKELLRDIENFIGREIEVLKVSKSNYNLTKDTSKSTHESLKSLTEQIAEIEELKRKKQKSRKKK